jgi:hypothetical protein
MVIGEAFLRRNERKAPVFLIVSVDFDNNCPTLFSRGLAFDCDLDSLTDRSAWLSVL